MSELSNTFETVSPCGGGGCTPGWSMSPANAALPDSPNGKDNWRADSGIVGQMHKEVPIKVNAWVDEGVAPLVAALNAFENVITLDSCEGYGNAL